LGVYTYKIIAEGIIKVNDKAEIAAIQTVGRRNWRSDLEPVGICISKGESTVLRRDI
jgi:hypothetical protein